MLVQVAGAHGIPAVHLGDRTEVDEPVHLDGFPEVARGVGGNPPADSCDLEQFSLAGGVGFLGGHLFGQFRMALGEEDRRVTGDVHGGQFLELLGGVGVVQVIEPGLAFGDLTLEVEHALPVDRPVQGRVPGGALFHEFGVEARFVEGLPFFGDQGEGLVAHAAPSPVGNDLLGIEVDVLGGNRVAGHLAGVQDLQVLAGMAVQLGEGGDAARHRASLSHNQVVGADEDRLLLAEVLEVQRPHDRGGDFPGVFLVELGHQDRPLDGDGRVCFKALLPESLDSFVHDLHPPMRTLSPNDFRFKAAARVFSSLGGSVSGRRYVLPHLAYLFLADVW